MRAALAAILTLGLAVGPIEAKVLVVSDRPPIDTGGFEYGYFGMADRMTRGVLNLLNELGVDYKLVPASSVKTEFLRTGQMVWNFNTPGAYAEQFDGVILLNPYAKTVSETPWPRSYTGFYPCSLTVGGVTKAPRVPHLWLYGAINGATLGGDLGVQRIRTTAGALPCSTGVDGSAAGSGTAGTWGAVPLINSGPSVTGTWFSASNQAGFPLSGTIPGGVRTLLRANQAHILGPYRWTKVLANNQDTLITGAGVDSVVVWERMNANLYAGAANTNPIKPIVFANIMGTQLCFDSLNAVPCEYDGVVTMFALARLDSLTGGKVFTKTKKAAIVISGGFERTLRRLPGGANDQDSTVIKATIDSLAALGVPLTVTVNADSIASYPNEVAWWRKLWAARFSPVATRGIADTNTTSGRWSKDRAVDVFGRFRNRAFYGDSVYHYVEGADSSIFQGLVTLRKRTKDAGLDKLSGTLIAPLDDWSPKNMAVKTNAMDSLIWVAQKAGYSAILTDVQRPEADIQRIRTNPLLVRGWHGDEKVRYSSLTGENFKFVGHTGYNITGSSLQYFPLPTDSASTPLTYSFGGTGPCTPSATYQMIGRFWSGFNDTGRDRDWFAYEGFSALGGYLDIRYSSADMFHEPRKASVFKLHVSDLGGIQNGPPTRPGYYAIKSLVRQFDAINKIAGRTVVRLTYPEDIEL